MTSPESVGEERKQVTESEELAVRSARVTAARKAAGYRSQEKFAIAMSKVLGGGFSFKMYRYVEEGRRDLSIREARAFMRLTGATLEFLTGQTGTIDVNEARGVSRGSPVLAWPSPVDLIAS